MEQSQPTGQLINTQPAPQQAPSPNDAVSLAQGQLQGGQHQPPQSNQQRAEKAKAAMGVATMLQRHLLHPKTASSSPQNASQQESESKTQDTPQEENKENVGEKMKEMELTMTQKLDEIRQEMKAEQQREMDMLKKTIQDALQ